VSARQDADLDRDRADLVDSASVHPDSLVENSPADGLLLDETEETLANSRLAAGCIEQASRLLAFLAVGADRNGDRILQILDPAREIAREASQDGGRGFGVGQSAVDGLDLDAEEAGNVPELVRLKVRVCLTGDHESVEVAALDELPGLAEGLVEEAQVEAHVVANHGSATDERPQLFRRLASDRAPATSAFVMPCICAPKMSLPGLTKVEKRSTIAPSRTRTAPISIRSATLGSRPVVSVSTTTNSQPGWLTFLTNSKTEPVPGSR